VVVGSFDRRCAVVVVGVGSFDQRCAVVMVWRFLSVADNRRLRSMTV
jgi:hypothetical protein